MLFSAFRCVKDYVMNDGSLAFKKDKSYSFAFLPDVKMNMTMQDESDSIHYMTDNDMEEAFNTRSSTPDPHYGWKFGF